MSLPDGVTLEQTREGYQIEHRGRRSREKRTITVDRQWYVYLDGELIGQIEYAMLTRETGPAARRYVSARWYSPGWRYRVAGDHWVVPTHGTWSEPVPSTQAECVRRLVTIKKGRPS